MLLHNIRKYIIMIIIIHFQQKKLQKLLESAVLELLGEVSVFNFLFILFILIF